MIIISILSFIFLALIIYLIAYIVWMKLKSRFSKPRFAFYVVASIISVCLYTTFSIAASGVSDIIYGIAYFTNALAQRQIFDLNAAANAIDGTPEKLAILVCGLVAMLAITSFGRLAVRTWDGPVTDAANTLARYGLDNSLPALAFVEAQYKLSGRTDTVLSEVATSREYPVSLPPARPAWHILARNTFLVRYTDAVLPETGWRQQNQIWLGKLYSSHEDNKDEDLVVVLFEQKPTAAEILHRLHSASVNFNVAAGQRWFAIYERSQDRENSPDENIEIDANFSISLTSYHKLMLDGLDLRRYARDLVKQFEEVTVGGTNVTLAQSYVTAHLDDDVNKRLPLTNVIHEWLQEPRRRHLAITGEYGQGKSTAMLEICVQWAKRLLANEPVNELVPLLIELRGKNPSEGAPEQFIAQWALRYKFKPDQIMNIIREGRALLIFEGFDELRNAGKQLERHELFNSLWRFAYPGCKLIFTGRPNFFLDQRERNTTLRVDDNHGAADNAFTQLYQISLFDIHDVESACRNFPENVRTGILRTARQHATFREIVLRPSMIPVVATIWPDIAELEAKGTAITSVTLLERYLSAVYTRKEAEIEREQREYNLPHAASYLVVPRAAREALTLAVVWQMALDDARNTIERDSFNAVIDKVLDPILASLQRPEVAPNVVKEIGILRDRISGDKRSDWVERICTDIASAGLFVPDPAGGPSNLRFPHKQYFEYLVAKVVWLVLTRPGDDTVKAVAQNGASSSAILTMINRSGSWQNLDALFGDDFSCFKTSKTSIVALIASKKVMGYLQYIMSPAFLASDIVLRYFLQRVIRNNLVVESKDFTGFNRDIELALASTANKISSFLAALTAAFSALVVSSTVIIVALTKSNDALSGKLLPALASLAFPPLALVLMMLFRGRAAIYMDLCGSRVINNTVLHEGFAHNRYRKAAIAEAEENLKYISNPATEPKISSIVTGLQIK